MRFGVIYRALTVNLLPSSVMAGSYMINRPDNFLRALKFIVPPLSKNTHKGQAGRVAVLGGSKDYTGAPYFSAISSLRSGCDLTYVLTSDTASQVVKGYDPELMVTPVYRSSVEGDDGLLEFQAADEMAGNVALYFGRLHCLVIGPGLGREAFLSDALKQIMKEVRSQKVPIVIDADGLHFVSSNPDLVRDNTLALLTPNVIEFSRLWTALGFDPSILCPSGDGTIIPSLEQVKHLASSLGNVTIILKGSVDHISDGINACTCDVPGGLKRCGGLGDILSGVLGTFMAWKRLYEQRNSTLDSSSQVSSDELMLNEGTSGEFVYSSLMASYLACHVVRMATRTAYNKHGRSTGALHVVNELESVMEELVPSPKV